MWSESQLRARGYRLEGFENVLGLDLAGPLDTAVSDGIEVRRSNDDDFEAWLRVVVDASGHPDTQGVPWHEEFPAAVIVTQPGSTSHQNARRRGFYLLYTRATLVKRP